MELVSRFRKDTGARGSVIELVREESKKKAEEMLLFFLTCYGLSVKSPPPNMCSPATDAVLVGVTDPSCHEDNSPALLLVWPLLLPDPSKQLQTPAVMEPC